MNTNHISYIRVKYITKYNLCTPFKHDIRNAMSESCLKGVQRLHFMKFREIRFQHGEKMIVFLPIIIFYQIEFSSHKNF